MKFTKATLFLSTLFITSMTLSGCENTQVSGSVSYGMSMGGGYPMYYGSGYPRRSTVVVVKPSRQHRSRPVSTKPARRR
jgi:hypothetical protein